MNTAENHANRAIGAAMDHQKKTIAAMIRIYCRSRHGADGEVCAQCRALCEYAMRRLERCPFGPQKPTCAKCPIHCYQPEMRQRIREVMRLAGPKMLLRHPILALRHQLESRRPVPQKRPLPS